MAVRIVLGASIALLLRASAVSACSCVPSFGCPMLGGSGGPVFLGTVLQVTDTGSTAFLSARKARIQVDEPLGGLAVDAREVDVLTGLGGGDCGVPFKAGEVYLVSGSVTSDGLIHASVCSSTRRIDALGAALWLLRQRRDGRAVPSLAGQLMRLDRNFNGPLGIRPSKPLGNTLVRVKSGERAYETQADSEGLYAFYGLPPGRYEFAPDLPQGTTLSWYIGSDSPDVPFDLKGAGCQERNIAVYASGSIQGRVLDSSNKPLSHAFVYIVPADEEVLPKESQLYWESQGKTDYFKFVHIPPGRYYVLVNPDDLKQPDFPYPRTFHPAVHDRESATVVTVRSGEQVKDADIRVQQEFAPRHLSVRVGWANGKAIRSFVYIVAKGSAKPELKSDASTDSMASVGDLKLVPTEGYEVHAELTCRYADERSVGPGAHLASNSVYIRPDDGRKELVLTIPAMACPVIQGKALVTGP